VIGLLQRVGEARVAVDGETVGAIGRGLLVFVGVQKGDDEARGERLLERLLGYRVFPDATGRMNLSLRDLCEVDPSERGSASGLAARLGSGPAGGLLLVPQFTLAADTKKGTRASFTSAAAPADGERLFDLLVQRARATHEWVATGRFGADMQVSLVNDGPVTFWLET
jgi:D-tyrosyl-tRNA(Tyr) deacylase